MPDLIRYATDRARFYTGALPWFLPGLAVSVVVAVPLSSPVARVLQARRPVAYLLIVSLGAILAATLPPGAGGFDTVADGVKACHIHRLGLAAADEYLGVTETSLNVLLFIPLGLAIALLPWSWRTLAVLVAAFALPFAIEAMQLLAPMLGRACESDDVVDNLLGLLVGLVVGGVVVAIVGVVRARASGRT